MTPSQAAKTAGFKSLKEVCELLDIRQSTLDYRYRNMPEVFEANLKQAEKLKKEQK